MSYDITLKIHESRSAARTELEDASRRAFLDELAHAPFELTEWETKFATDLRQRAPATRPVFTPRQREKIDQLRSAYAYRLPTGGAARPAVLRAERVPASLPGACGYQIRAEGEDRRRCCGEPAVRKLNSGLELCARHETQRRQQLERMRQWKTRNLR